MTRSLELWLVRHGESTYNAEGRYAGWSDPDLTEAGVAMASALAPRLLVPGHGPVGTPESLQVMSQYVSRLDGLARKMVEDGEAEETIDSMAIPQPYDDWLFASFFPGNVHFLYQRYSQERAGRL